MTTRTRACVLAWIGLLLLLAATVGSAFVAMGRWNLVANLAIAAAKAAVVVVVFMQLRTASTTTRLAAAAGVAWLALLVLLAGVDFAAR
ncbi:MAG: cytochrome C oxidase subunit IV family protein [Burkholderiales bacterium]